MRKTNLMMAGLMGASLLALAPAANADPAGVKVGTLTCNVASGWGHVVASSRRMDCRYHRTNGRTERYTGTMSRYGVDLGYTQGGALVWEVVAPTSDVGRGALEGNYAGAAANATVGLGAGANILVGGFDRSIALQPLSLEGNTGLAVAAGVGVMRLRAA